MGKKRAKKPAQTQEPPEIPSGLELATIYYGLPRKERKWPAVAMRLGYDPSGEGFRAVCDAMNHKAREYEIAHPEAFQHIVYADTAQILVPRCAEFEKRLCEQFHLRGAIVAQVRDPEKESVDIRDMPDNVRHSELGPWAAELFRSMLRPNDKVGVGAGRAVLSMATNLRMHPMKETAVVSLTGDHAQNVGERYSAPEIAYTDADVVAGVVARRLGTRTQITIRSGIGADPTATGAFRDKQLRDINIAFVGVGIFAGGHSLCLYSDLDGVGAKLQELRAHTTGLHDRFGQQFVADICNHLFVMKSGAWSEVKENDRQLLEEQVNELNDVLLAPAPKNYSDICRSGSVVAIGGGHHKVEAMRHILLQSQLNAAELNPGWITHLVTDEQLAQQLLK